MPAFQQVVIAETPPASTGGSGLTIGIALALPLTVFSIAGSPALDGGTLIGAFINQSANAFFAGPTSGGASTPVFRSMVVADLPALADKSVYANTSGGTATPLGTTLSALLDSIIGSSQGNLATRNATGWVAMAPGTSTYALTSNGAGANLSYTDKDSGRRFTFASVAPTVPTPAPGDRWLSSASGIQYTYVNDGTSSQWVEL